MITNCYSKRSLPQKKVHDWVFNLANTVGTDESHGQRQCYSLKLNKSKSEGRRVLSLAKFSIIVINFYPSFKTYVLGAQKICLIDKLCFNETVLLSTYNICFG